MQFIIPPKKGYSGLIKNNIFFFYNTILTIIKTNEI